MKGSREYFWRNGKKQKPQIKIITCNGCGHKFTPGRRPDGLPNGMGFIAEGGKAINMCADCLIKQGTLLEKGGEE